MHRIPEYILLFVALVLLQVFLFDNLNLGVWVHPLVYVGFIVLLPMEMKQGWMLLSGLVLGVTIDLLLATAGLHTIATLLSAFARRPLLLLMSGKETMGDGGVPCSARIGTGKFLRYCTAVILVHCSVFFLFEAFGVRWFHITAVKIVASTAVTVLLIYVVQLLYRKPVR